MSGPRPMNGEQLLPRRRKPLSWKDVRECQRRGYRLVEVVSNRGRTFVNLVTAKGSPRTREVR